MQLRPEPPPGGAARWTSGPSAPCGSSRASSSFIALVPHPPHHQQEIIVFCVIVPSIILHEVSHGWVANAFGDDTAKRAGRLTLNPIAHVDPVGTLIVPALLSLAGAGVFGWAKPVPVNVGTLAQPAQPGRAGVAGGPGHQRRARPPIAAVVFIQVIRPGLPTVRQSSRPARRSSSTSAWSTCGSASST